tara:strand:- start:49 stop:510 length:462 start_codon:yes stop_codon:yes gene_type:complete
MPKIIKSCSLDERTIEIANSKENFSGWVREKLLEEIQYTIPCNYFPLDALKSYNGLTVLEAVPEGEICNGVKKPVCPTCWPQGAPTNEDWIAYAQRHIDLDELRERTNQHWKWKVDLEKQQIKNHINDSKKRGEKPKRAYLRRFLTWIWTFIW